MYKLDSITHNLIYQKIEKELLKNVVSSTSLHASVYLGLTNLSSEKGLVISYDALAPYHPGALPNNPDILEWGKRLLVKAITEKYNFTVKSTTNDALTDFPRILSLLWSNGYDTEIAIFATNQLKNRLHSIELGSDFDLPLPLISQAEAEGNFSRLTVYNDMLEELFSTSAERPRKGVVKAVQSAMNAPWRFSEICKFRDKCTELKLKFAESDPAKVSQIDELFAASFDLDITEKNAFSGKHSNEFKPEDIYVQMQKALFKSMTPVRNPEFVLLTGQPGCNKFAYAQTNYPENYVFISNGICRSFLPNCVDIYNQGGDILAATDHYADRLCLDIIAYAMTEKYNIVCMTSLGHELLTDVAKTVLESQHTLTFKIMAVNDCQSRVGAYLRFYDEVSRLGYGVLVPSNFMDRSYDHALNTASIFEAENLFTTLSVVSQSGEEIYRAVPGDKRRAVNAITSHREKIWSDAETKLFNEMCAKALQQFKGNRAITQDIMSVRERSAKYAYRPSIKIPRRK